MDALRFSDDASCEISFPLPWCILYPMLSSSPGLAFSLDVSDTSRERLFPTRSFVLLFFCFPASCHTQGSALARMSLADLRALVTRGMTQYEREEKTMDILLFAEIFDHIVRIDRVLSVEGGALLLAGRSGACCLLCKAQALRCPCLHTAVCCLHEHV